MLTEIRKNAAYRYTTWWADVRRGSEEEVKEGGLRRQQQQKLHHHHHQRAHTHVRAARQHHQRGPQLLCSASLDNTHVHAHAHTRTYTNTHVRSRTHTYTHVHTHAHTQKYEGNLIFEAEHFISSFRRGGVLITDYRVSTTNFPFPRLTKGERQETMGRGVPCDAPTGSATGLRPMGNERTRRALETWGGISARTDDDASKSRYDQILERRVREFRAR